MNKPEKIEGTRDYLYKGFVIGRYENLNGGVRYNITNRINREARFNVKTIKAAAAWIDAITK